MPEDTTAIMAQLVEHLDPGSVITGFVAVAEIIDPDGNTAIWTSAPETATKWATLGLLTYALEREKQMLADDEDDE